MLSNFIENSLDAAKSYISVTIKPLNKQLSLNIKNDFDGRDKKGFRRRICDNQADGQRFWNKECKRNIEIKRRFFKN